MQILRLHIRYAISSCNTIGTHLIFFFFYFKNGDTVGNFFYLREEIFFHGDILNYQLQFRREREIRDCVTQNKFRSNYLTSKALSLWSKFDPNYRHQSKTIGEY